MYKDGEDGVLKKSRYEAGGDATAGRRGAGEVERGVDSEAACKHGEKMT